MPDLKQKLIDYDIIGFSFDEFELFLSADVSGGITSDTSLAGNLPLHLMGVGDNAMIKVLGGSVLIHLISPCGGHWYKAFPKTMTINQMKKIIMPLAGFLKHTSGVNEMLVTDFILFLQRGRTYKKLQGEAQVGAVLSNEDCVYFIDDSILHGYPTAAVCCGQGFVGTLASSGGTVLDVKLRVQSQFGFPVSSVDVQKPDGSSLRDHESYNSQAIIFVS